MPADPTPETELKARLAAFDSALHSQHAAARPADRMDMNASYAKGFGRASRIGLELAVALLIGLALGYALDRVAGTMPLFILLFSLLGFAAGIMNAWRALNGQYGKVGFADTTNEDK